MLGIFAIFFLVLHTVKSAYSPTGHNVVVYWGQGSNQESLGTYCQKNDFDVVLISFLNNFGKDSASFNFGNACWGDKCPQVEKDILTCQSMGIKVLLSLGGDSRLGKYLYSNDKDGISGARVIYDMFNPRGDPSITKPFGNAEIDGFDLDLENQKQNGIAAMVAELRRLWTSKTLLISAAPQCPYPDANVFKPLQDENAKIDMALVQFYNNDKCSFFNDKKFKGSWDTWYKFVTEQSGNPNGMKIYIALATSASKKYIVSIDDVKSKTQDIIKEPAFGGFALWDVTTGEARQENGISYVQGLKNILTSNIYKRATTVLVPFGKSVATGTLN